MAAAPAPYAPVDANGAFSQAGSQRSFAGGAPKATLRGWRLASTPMRARGRAPLTAAAGDAHAISAMLGKGNRLLFSAYDIRPPLVTRLPRQITANLDALVAAACPGDTIVLLWPRRNRSRRSARLRDASGNLRHLLATASVGWTDRRHPVRPRAW
jgi:hypothetical protein